MSLTGRGRLSLRLRLIRARRVMDIPGTACQWRYLPKDLPSKSTVFRCKSWDLRFRALPREIAARRSSHGAKFGETVSMLSYVDGPVGKWFF